MTTRGSRLAAIAPKLPRAVATGVGIEDDPEFGKSIGLNS
jgi:hypothetical protein